MAVIPLLPTQLQAQAPVPAAGGADVAQDPGSPIIVTGTRRQGITVADSSTPIDVISSETLAAQGYSDTNDLLRTAIPSLNVQRFVAQSFSVAIRPFTLRGLSPDQSLMLVNGKRRHRSAAVQLSRLPLSSGSQGPDLSTIPSIAIDRVEVLRDGAAAQYGSDAIAGVVNFQLKNDSEGGSLTARYGQFYEGDGEELTLQGNIGLPLIDGGFANLSAEYTRAKPTDRSIQRADAAALIAAGNTEIADPAQPWGNPDSEGIRFFVNAEQPIGDVTLYAFGNWARTNVEANQFFRSPDPAGSRRDIFASVPLTEQPGGQRFSFASLYPGGLLPIHDYTVYDASLATGVRGGIGGLSYDLSGSYASSVVRNSVYDTINPSLGPDAPTRYFTGAQKQRELQLHGDFVYPWEIGLASPLNVAFGGEYRRETWEKTAGEPDSYRAGPFARVFDPDAGRFIGLAVGSSAFPGFTPADSGEWSRSNWAVYVDLEAEVIDGLTLGTAGRYEKFTDFGDTFNYKFTARYEFTDWLSVRGSYNTGFHAPTPGQQHVKATSTSIDVTTGSLLEIVTFPPDTPIAQYYGATALDAEKSKNLSLGAVVNLSNGLLFTIDYFNIKIRDRIGVTSTINITAADRAALIAQGIDPGSTQGVAFFANAFDTRTQGFDAVLSKVWSFDSGSKFNLSAAVNYTSTEVVGDRTSQLFGRAVDRKRLIEISHFNPQWRGYTTAIFETGRWNFLARANYYGKWTTAVANVPTAVAYDQVRGAEWLFDAEVGFDLTDTIHLAVGGNNLFDAYPDKEELIANRNNGQDYPDLSPFGFSGGFWYVRAEVKF